MLTARSEVTDKVEALEIGADDYLTKPFEVSEMTARVRALVRRSQGLREVPADHVIRVGAAEVNLSTREAETVTGERIVLSEKEAAILEVLARAGGQPVSRSEILDRAWGTEEYPTERTVDNFLLRLRRLFEPEPDHPRYILTVRGSGYRLVV
jgi:DNA-binding response OmpR family regulator